MGMINRWVFYLRDGRSVEFLGESLDIVQKVGIEGYEITIGEKIMGFVPVNDMMCFLNAGAIPLPSDIGSPDKEFSDAR